MSKKKRQKQKQKNLLRVWNRKIQNKEVVRKTAEVLGINANIVQLIIDLYWEQFINVLLTEGDINTPIGIVALKYRLLGKQVHFSIEVLDSTYKYAIAKIRLLISDRLILELALRAMLEKQLKLLEQGADSYEIPEVGK